MIDRFQFTLLGAWGGDPLDDRCVEERIVLPPGWVESSNPFLCLFRPWLDEPIYSCIDFDLAKQIARGFDAIQDRYLNWFLLQEPYNGPS